VQTSIRPGVYRHYKGNLYRVMDVATHSETLEKVVIYRPLYGERALWVRPLAMFLEEVEVAGQRVPRFAWEGPASAPAAAPAVVKLPEGQARPVAATREPAPAPLAAAPEASLEERVKVAMARGDDRPDFSSVPIFDDPAMALKVGAAVGVLILLLIWLF
jgi:hypothetical protein